MTSRNIIVYTDGSCSKNGSPNAYGGIGIHFPNGELKDISKVYRQAGCSNQRTELYAIITAVRYIGKKFDLRHTTVTIYTDSEYVINCITKWADAWVRNGWITKSGTSVCNKDFIETLYKYYHKYHIELRHVAAHTGNDDDHSIANDVADTLARRATTRRNQELSDEAQQIVIESEQNPEQIVIETGPPNRSYNRPYNRSRRNTDVEIELVGI